MTITIGYTIYIVSHQFELYFSVALELLDLAKMHSNILTNIFAFVLTLIFFFFDTLFKKTQHSFTVFLKNPKTSFKRQTYVTLVESCFYWCCFVQKPLTRCKHYAEFKKHATPTFVYVFNFISGVLEHVNFYLSIQWPFCIKNELTWFVFNSL